MRIKLSYVFQFFEPIIYFATAWFLVVILYTLRLSDLLSHNTGMAWITLIGLVFFFSLGYCSSFFFNRKLLLINSFSSDFNFSSIEKAVVRLFVFWLFFIIVEIIYSGGIPIIWLLMGKSKGYGDFGIPSLHGFMNALQLSLTIVSFSIYLNGKKKFFLRLTIFFLIWSMMMITRQVVIVAAIEIFFIYVIHERNRVKILKKLFTWTFFGILLFGFIGDIRTGADKFVWLAQPSKNWPEWIPSGFLWVYIYLVTPLNNLLYNFSFEIKEYDFLFSNTNSLLFPSFIRSVIFGNETYLKSGLLVTQAFNVSSSFASPYIDAGFYGVALFTLFIGFCSGFFWWNKGRSRIFYRAIIFQMLVLSIFYNHFFYLPVAFQLVFIPFFFKRFKLSKP